MRISLTLLFAILSRSFLYSQDAFPKFKSTQQTFQEYIISNLGSSDSSFSILCDTSIGLIQFSISNDGTTDSITISEGCPKEIRAKLYDIVSSSKWSAVKSKNNASTSSTIVLPIAICIETGCAERYIKRGFGFGGDFARMFPKSNHALYLNCILLDPLIYTVKGN